MGGDKFDLSTGYPQTYPQSYPQGCLSLSCKVVLCINPFRPRRGVEYACGQCRCCRINRARMWTGRILLEAAVWPESSFATLTYAPEHLPEGGSLSNEHWRELTWLIGYRYFGCGEYGEQFGRPHYHLILFGLGPSSAQAFLETRWKYGHVLALPLETRSAAYVARYTIKKYVRKEAPGPHLLPEFQRMSRRPAIGDPGLGVMKDWLVSSSGARFLADHQDVPNTIRAQGVSYPLGRTLVLKLRQAAGLPDALPELQEARRRERLILDCEELRAMTENRRVAQYERVTGQLSARGSL